MSERRNTALSILPTEHSKINLKYSLCIRRSALCATSILLPYQTRNPSAGPPQPSHVPTPTRLYHRDIGLNIPGKLQLDRARENQPRNHLLSIFGTSAPKVSLLVAVRIELFFFAEFRLLYYTGRRPTSAVEYYIYHGLRQSLEP